MLYHIPKTSSAPVVQLIHELQLQDDVKIETLSFDHVRNDVKYGALNPKRSVPALKLRGGASYTGSLITESGAIISLLLEVTGECAAWSAVQRTKMWRAIFYTGTHGFSSGRKSVPQDNRRAVTRRSSRRPRRRSSRRSRRC